LAWREQLTLRGLRTIRYALLWLLGIPIPTYEEVHQFSEKELADLSIAIAMVNAWNRLAIGSRATHPADVKRAA
jgi:alkylhydroperoxidase family enzyme